MTAKTVALPSQLAEGLPLTVVPSDQPRSDDERAKILANPGFGTNFTDHMVLVRWTEDQALRTQLAPLAGKPYFVFHEAFDYFEEAYGLGHRGVFALGADVQPGARHVAAMRDELKAAGPTCVFTEPPLQPKIATTLSSGLPVTLVELDPLGARVPVNAGGYAQLLQSVGDTLGGCLGKLP